MPRVKTIITISEPNGQPMGRSWSPKLVATPAAKQYAAYYLFQSDFRSVDICVRRYLETDMLALDPEQLVWLDSALIRYRRCFCSGVRSSIEYLLDELGDCQRALHKKIIAVANYHVAHSSNGFEQGWPGVEVAEQEEGSLLRGEPSWHGYFTMGLTGADVEQLGALARHFSAKLDVAIAERSLRMKAEFAELTDHEVRALPDLKPFDCGEADVQRKWPYWE